MLPTKVQPAYLLSAIIGVLALVASAGGLFVEGLYRDKTWTSSQLRGNDLVTLIVVVPLLVAAMVHSRRGSQRAQLVWLGSLAYMLYNYAFYLFGAAFNDYFLIYAALLALTILTFLFALPTIDAAGIGRQFRLRTPVRWISVYLLLIAVFLGGMWITQSLRFVATGEVPPVIIDSEHPTSVVFALDLALLVPFLVVAAIWLWQHRPWGYVLGAILLVKGTAYPLALVAMSVFAHDAGIPGAFDLMPLWVGFTVVSLVAAGFLFGNMGSTPRLAPAGEWRALRDDRQAKNRGCRRHSARQHQERRERHEPTTTRGFRLDRSRHRNRDQRDPGSARLQDHQVPDV